VTKDRPHLFILLALSLLTALVYARAAFFPFHLLDDPFVIQTNPNLGFTLENLRWAFTTNFSGNWHPLTWLSFMLDYALFGLSPMGYHVVNVLLHVANTILLYLAFRRLTGAAWRSAAVAALFALHPLHVESVVWITERKDVLSALFWMATLNLYALYAQQGGRRWYYLSLAAFALGLMCKPMLVTLPVILLLLDYWPLKRSSFAVTDAATRRQELSRVGALVREKLPFLGLSVAASVVAVFAQGSVQAVTSLGLFSVEERIANALLSYVRYLGKMALPVELAAFYPMRLVAWWEAALATLVLVGLVLCALKLSRKFPYLIVGLLWYLVTLMPVIGLIQVGSQSMADRYSYLPLIGIFVMLAWAMTDLAAKYPGSQTVIQVVSGIVIAGCAVLAWVQLGYWKDNVTLFERAVSVTEANQFARFNLAVAYSGVGKNDLALRELQEYLKLVQDDHLAYNLTGKLLERAGRPGEAARMYARAVELQPDNPRYLNNYGISLLQQGRVDEAIRHLSEAVRLKPDFAQAASNLAFAQSRKARGGP
jgi:protein O-mannosyl-transferase